MNKSVWEATKLNLKTVRIPYAITASLFVFMLAVDLIKLFAFWSGSDIGEQTNVSIGNLIWLLIPLAAIYIAAKNLRRMVNLGGKRKQFFVGSFIGYLILAAAVSLAGTLMYYFYDSFILNTGMYKGLINLLDVWGWAVRGPVIAFIQQFVFLFLLAVLTHTLTLLQDSWHGWVIDVLIAVFIAVFTAIAPLRAALYGFFRLILFHPNAILQIAACAILAVGLYTLSYSALNRKKI